MSMSVKRLDPLVVELFESGYSADEIAQESGYPIAQIRDQIDRMLSQWESVMKSDPTRGELRSIYSLERLYRRMAHAVVYPTPAAEEPTDDTEPQGRRLRLAKRAADILDIKPLQGIERCIELRMKLVAGLPEPATHNAEEPTVVVDLSKLSRETLRELLEVSSDVVTDA